MALATIIAAKVAPTKSLFMPNAILVLNAGSSSLKFSVFELDNVELTSIITGQIESIGTAPRLKAKDGTGQVLIDKTWQPTEIANHAQARLNHNLA